MNREQHNYLHIPKTGGTALKYVVASHNRANKPEPMLSVPKGGHTQHLSGMENAFFAIRHPWERFCSGFWERVNMPKRKELSESEYRDVEDFGYKDYDPEEEYILSTCHTPNEFLTFLREKNYNQHTRPGLFELTASITKWLGNINEFKKYEHKVKLAFHINNFNNAMKTHYNIDMPADPFKMRSKSLFDNTEQNDISPVNRIWFEREFRPMDYELIAYIKTRPFYYE